MVQPHHSITRTGQQLCPWSHRQDYATSLSSRKEIGHFSSLIFSHSTIDAHAHTSIFHFFPSSVFTVLISLLPVVSLLWRVGVIPLFLSQSSLHRSMSPSRGGKILVPSGLWHDWVACNGILHHPHPPPAVQSLYPNTLLLSPSQTLLF